MQADQAGDEYRQVHLSGDGLGVCQDQHQRLPHRFRPPPVGGYGGHVAPHNDGVVDSCVRRNDKRENVPRRQARQTAWRVNELPTLPAANDGFSMARGPPAVPGANRGVGGKKTLKRRLESERKTVLERERLTATMVTGAEVVS
ncbi:MAG: hypothetical protein ACYS9T_07060 [Planctomycetota bacterium]